jgi:hypothetical protein
MIGTGISLLVAVTGVAFSLPPSKAPIDVRFHASITVQSVRWILILKVCGSGGQGVVWKFNIAHMLCITI